MLHRVERTDLMDSNREGVKSVRSDYRVDDDIRALFSEFKIVLHEEQLYA